MMMASRNSLFGEENPRGEVVEWLHSALPSFDSCPVQCPSKFWLTGFKSRSVDSDAAEVASLNPSRSSLSALKGS